MIVGRAAVHIPDIFQTVNDLVAGSGLMYDDTGKHELKAVPNRWRLYRGVHP
jgi:hypothetical protein